MRKRPKAPEIPDIKPLPKAPTPASFISNANAANIFNANYGKLAGASRPNKYINRNLGASPSNVGAPSLIGSR